MILQFTGLSGSGKSTLASLVKTLLQKNGYSVTVLDGDKIRKTLSVDLGFSKADRIEHIARMGIAAQKAETEIVIISAINPYQYSRKQLKTLYNAKLIWLNCNLKTLQSRDTKGLYYRAALPDAHPEKLNNLTGVNDTFELPLDADLVIQTDSENAEASALRLYYFIVNAPEFSERLYPDLNSFNKQLVH